MSVSRVWQRGTIFSRVNNLIRAGTLHYEDRPLWFDIYKRFPPLEEPDCNRKIQERPVMDILYAEDTARAEGDKKGERDAVIFDLMTKPEK